MNLYSVFHWTIIVGGVNWLMKATLLRKIFVLRPSYSHGSANTYGSAVSHGHVDAYGHCWHSFSGVDWDATFSGIKQADFRLEMWKCNGREQLLFQVGSFCEQIPWLRVKKWPHSNKHAWNVLVVRHKSFVVLDFFCTELAQEMIFGGIRDWDKIKSDERLLGLNIYLWACLKT